MKQFRGASVLTATVLAFGTITPLVGNSVATVQGDGRLERLRLKAALVVLDAGAVIPGISDNYTRTVPDLGVYESSQGLPHCGPRPIRVAEAADLLKQEVASRLLPGGEKLRILVDKVIARGRGGGKRPEVVTEEVVKEVADAGFNIYSPRVGGNDEQQIRRVEGFAQKHGLRHVAWLSGTRKAGAEGVAYVSRAGKVHTVLNPNSDEYWEWLSAPILMQAEVSQECPSFLGVFLDFEIYEQPVAWAFNLSYDEKILGEFARARNIEIPQLTPGQRHPWLVENKMHDAFEEFQIDSWRARCRELRRRIDEFNPRFRFFIYPGPSSAFIVQAAGPEWSTEAAPAIFADFDTYGRPSWRTGQIKESHQDALSGNLKLLEKDLAILRTAGFPFQYLGGIDPAVKGADPEFSARNGVLAADTADGYWVFYEGPKWDTPEHAEYWHWFTRANEAIRQEKYEFWKEPRETPDPFEAGSNTTAPVL